MDAPIKGDWTALEKMASDVRAWDKLVERLKEKCTQLPDTATTTTKARRSTRLRQKRPSPLKKKAMKRFSAQRFKKAKKTLSKALSTTQRQTDIREFFKPTKRAKRRPKSAAAALTRTQTPDTPPQPAQPPQPKQRPRKNPPLRQQQRTQWARDYYKQHFATTAEFFDDHYQPQQPIRTDPRTPTQLQPPSRTRTPSPAPPIPINTAIMAALNAGLAELTNTATHHRTRPAPSKNTPATPTNHPANKTAISNNTNETRKQLIHRLHKQQKRARRKASQTITPPHTSHSPKPITPELWCESTPIPTPSPPTPRHTAYTQLNNIRVLVL